MIQQGLNSEAENMTLAYTFNVTHFLNDLQAGDVGTWCILVVTLFFCGWQAYEKYCTFSSPVDAAEE